MSASSEKVISPDLNSSDGLKFFDALPNRNLQVLVRFNHRAITTTRPNNLGQLDLT